ncbi:MAG: polyprenol monophosphomannose synthase [bacterium]|nr:polyprenol monophosphomannose synthase [bacterium]
MLDRLAIVIPTYNEKQNIADLIPILLEKHPTARIYVVDDNSPDGTAEIVQKFASQFENVRLIFRNQKDGIATAYLDAFARIIVDNAINFILTMDSDFSHHPDDIPKLLRYAQSHDLVIGSRYVPGGSVVNWDVSRRLLSRSANRYAKFITNVPINDLTAGFVLYGREILARVLLQEKIKSNAYGYQIEMKYLAHKNNARIKEVPITFRKQNSSVSKFGRQSIWEGITIPWDLRLRDKLKK